MSVRADHDAMRVALLVAPETTPAVVYGLHEVLGAVGTLGAPFRPEGRTRPRPMRPFFVSRDGGPFVTSAGVPFRSTSSLADADGCAVAIVTDLDLGGDADPRGRWVAEGEWLRSAFERGAAICSVCTGSVLLAEAGLLDGIDATTHWAAAPLFAERYPSVRLRTERILCAAGPDSRIVTSGGSGSWADLVLYLIARFRGASEAMLIAKAFVLGDHSDGQLPFAILGRPRRHDDAVVARCQEWIAEHYAVPAPVAAMIAHSGLPERTFKRRFKAATGYTPVEYVQTLRVEEAKQMLEASALSVDAIADSVGYRDPASFRKVFKRCAGVTPASYRQRFCRAAWIGQRS